MLGDGFPAVGGAELMSKDGGGPGCQPIVSQDEKMAESGDKATSDVNAHSTNGG